MTRFKKWGDGSSVHQLINKQSPEGRNLFLRLRCTLIWTSPVDTLSGLKREGEKQNADVMLILQLGDQTSVKEGPGSLPTSQAIPIQWLDSVPCFCGPLLLTRRKEESGSHTATCDQRQRSCSAADSVNVLFYLSSLLSPRTERTENTTRFRDSVTCFFLLGRTRTFPFIIKWPYLQLRMCKWTDIESK